MKRILYIISSVLLLVACNKNEIARFEKGDTNVYFNQESMGVSVGEILSIPVTVANLPGEKVTVNFVVTDSTAIEGVDYEIISGKECVFENGHGTEYIVVRTYARDADSLSRRFFEIDLEPVEGFRYNSRGSMLVELRNYSNHPLFNLLGDAQMKGADYFSGEAEFPVNIYPDDENDLTLYLSGVTGGASFGGVLPDLKMSVDTIAKTIHIEAEVFTNYRLGSITGDIEIVRGEVVANSINFGASPVKCTYKPNGTINFEDWFGAFWASGPAKDSFLFFYYGYFAGDYRSVITK